MCGLHEIEKRVEMDAAYRRKRAKLMLKELEHMLQTVAELGSQAENFEKSYGEILEDMPELGEKVAAIARELGIALPSVSTPTEVEDKPGLFERITGRGRFYEQLGLQILDLAKRRRSETGGIMTLAEVVILVNKRRRHNVSQVDVARAIHHLTSAKLIPGLHKLKSGIKIVEFVPREFTEDQVIVLSLASRTGFTTLEDVMTQTRWNRERALAALQSLKESGAAKLDESYAHGTRYFFPGLTPSA